MHSKPKNFPEYHHDEEYEEYPMINPPPRVTYVDEHAEKFHRVPRRPSPRRRSPSKPRRDRAESVDAVHYFRNDRRQRNADYQINNYVDPRKQRYYSNSQHFIRGIPANATPNSRLRRVSKEITFRSRPLFSA